MKQLITISPEGEVRGLQMKRGRGLDLRKLGKAKIERSSLIEWDEYHQQWSINLLKPDRTAGLVFLKEVGLEGMHPLGCDEVHGVFSEYYFNDYEDAVTAEVQLIQAIRKQKGVDAV